MKKTAALWLMSAWAVWAAEQVGTVSGSGLTLRGQAVPGVVESLPLLSGDEIVTSTGPAAIALWDKSGITEEANTQLWVERQADRTTICMSRGSLRFSTAPGAQITVCALGQRIELEPSSEGTIAIEAADRVRAAASKGAVRVVKGGTCACEKNAWSTKKRVLVIVGVAAAAGAGTAIDLAVGGEPEPVSPSRP